MRCTGMYLLAVVTVDLSSAAVLMLPMFPARGALVSCTGLRPSVAAADSPHSLHAYWI